MPAAKKAEQITGFGYDPDFGGLDLSGCPSARGLPADTSFIDENFGGLDSSGRGTGSKALKEFLRQQTAEQEGPSTVHVGGQPFKIRFHENVWHGEGTLNGQRHRLTANDRAALLDKLMALAKEEAIHELTRAEQLQVIRLCQNGQKHEGIDYYLKLALGQSRYADDADMVANPELLPLMDEVAEFTWFHSTPQAEDSDPWHAFKDEFLNGRPVTHDLLDAAFEAFQAHQKQDRYTLLTSQLDEPKAAPLEVAAALENMSDEQIDSSYKGVARELAQSYRR